jgi:hypothetical protein
MEEGSVIFDVCFGGDSTEVSCKYCEVTLSGCLLFYGSGDFGKGDLIAGFAPGEWQSFQERVNA